jgi:hypothetical protein
MMIHPLIYSRHGIITIFPCTFTGFSYPRGSHCETIPMSAFVEATVLFQWLVIVNGSSCWTGHWDIAVSRQILNRVANLHASSTLESLAIKLEHQEHSLLVRDWKEILQHRQYVKPSNVVQLYPRYVIVYVFRANLKRSTCEVSLQIIAWYVGREDAISCKV